MPLVVYNGKLYCGTLPSAGVYRFDGDGTWTSIGPPAAAAVTKLGSTLRRLVSPNPNRFAARVSPIAGSACQYV